MHPRPAAIGEGGEGKVLRGVSADILAIICPNVCMYESRSETLAVLSAEAVANNLRVIDAI